MNALPETPPPSSSLEDLFEDLDFADEQHKQREKYPQVELEWLATSTFNHAIDHYVHSDDAKCREWANQAFVVAQWMEDDGTLRGILMEKFASLQLQDK